MKIKIILLFSMCLMLVFARNVTNAATETTPLTQQEMAQVLDAYGLFEGTGNGYELNRQPTRLEGLVMLTRLIGAEPTILASSSKSSVFSDVPSWGIKYTNYAFEQKLTNGKPNGLYGAQDLIAYKEYVTFLLRSLGYSETSNDFSWATVFEKAVAIELITKEQSTHTTLTRGDMVHLSYTALSLNYKNSSKKLLQSLSAQTGVSTGNNILLDNFILTSETDATQAIIRAQNYLKTIGGGNLVFSGKSYLIKPSRIYIPSNINWLGTTGARIHSKETSGYNILISTETGAKNITIKNLIFDQSGDSAMVPNINSSKGSFILHISNSDQVQMVNNTFYTYGVCAVLAQSSYNYPTKNISLIGNKAYFKRKVDVFYDVSVFNIDGKTVTVTDNYVEGIEVAGFKYSKPRSGFEIHMPNGTINRNTAINAEIGILHVNWPMLWNTYEPTYVGQLEIGNNVVKKAIIGIDIWSANTLAGTVTRNLTIHDNNIGLVLDSISTPAKGITLSDGDISNSSFENIVINKNTIAMIIDPAVTDVTKRLSQIIPGESTGAMCMNVRSTINGLTITNNTVTNFPYSFLNLYRRNNNGENQVHNNVVVKNNTVIDTAYMKTYGRNFEAVFNVGKSKNVTIDGNLIDFKTKQPLNLLAKLEAVETLNFTNNDYNGPTLNLSSVLPIRVYDGVIGTWANSKQIYVTNSQQCLAGDIILTPNGQKATIASVSGNYIFLIQDVLTWTGGMTITLVV